MRSNKLAFTLVEVLVVIAIIAILVAIILPIMSRVKATAKTTTCVSNLRQVGIALNTFAGENNNQLPYGFGPNPGWSGGDTDWGFALKDYLRNESSTGGKSALICPAADFKGIAAPDVKRTYTAGSALYGLNSYNNDNDGSQQRRLTSIGQMNNALWVIDGVQQGMTPYAFVNVTYEQLQSDLSANVSGTVAFRHSDRTNCLFANGSVKTMSRGDLRVLYTDKATWLALPK